MKMENKKFNHLTVIKDVGRTPARKIIYLCKCDCGNFTEVISAHLKNGNTKSCGCKKSEFISKAKYKHGRKSGDPTYMSWRAMKERCEKRKVYKDKNITVCSEWKDDFMAFLCDMGERPENTTIDRIDNSKGYYKENCRWATNKEQGRNKDNNRWITYAGQTLLISEWEKRLGFNSGVLNKRLKRGWSVERSIVTKLQTKQDKQNNQTTKGSIKWHH